MKAWIALATSRPIGVSIIFVALSLLGVLSLRSLAVDLMPDVEVPWISITTGYEGVAPEEIETLITRPIEKQMAGVEGVELLEAQSAEGLSRVFLRFDWSMDPKVALDEVRMALDRARAQLPLEAEPPNIYKFNLDSGAALKLSLSGSEDMRQLKFLAEQRIAPELERLPGVASVSARGGQDREIRVALDLRQLLALGIRPSEVVDALRTQNLSVSAGTLQDAGKEVLIRADGEFATLNDIRQTVVKVVNGRPVRVIDIARVMDTIREIKSKLWIDGKPGIELSVFKQTGANTVEIAERVRDELKLVNERYRGQAHLELLYDSSEYIQRAVTGVRESALWGAALAVLVLLIFLRSFRATLVVGAAIPISVLTTFILMNNQGMTLNLISFGGLALGIGILVDGAVVILESIYRKRADGLPPASAAVEGSTEVAGAVLAGTLTTTAVFIPVVFLGDLAGIVFGEMAAVVTFSLLCALVVALTLVPMLAARLLLAPSRKPSRVDRALENALDGLDKRYGRFLNSCLAAPWAIIFAAVCLLASSYLLFEQVGKELMPEADEAQVEADLELPLGTPLEATEKVIFELERAMSSVLLPEEIEHRLVSVGPEAWWRMDGANTGEVEILLVPRTERKRDVLELVPLIQDALADIPGAKIQVRPRSTNPLARIIRGGDDRLAVEIRGHDLKQAEELAQQVRGLMKKVPGVKSAYSDRELGALERTIVVDRQKAAELGLSGSEIARAVEASVTGIIATRFRDRGDEFDIRVQLEAQQLSQAAELFELPLITATGQQIPLHAIAKLQPRVGPSSIRRVNQERVVRVSAWPSGRPLGEIARDVQTQLDSLTVPDDFRVTVEGESASQNETFDSLRIGILLSLFLVFAVMSIQFESLKQPLIIMLSVPFAFTGLCVSLLVTGTTFNMYSFLGAIVLIGIVVNNAIVMLDYANTLRRTEGFSAHAAILKAGERRLRPILMTTLTTLLGLVPLALGLGEGSEMQAPMARAIVGGLLSSTVVTLVLIPAVYVLVEHRPGAAPRHRRDRNEGGAAPAQ